MALNKAAVLKKLQFLKPGDTCWVAFSGGVDSTVLLHLLCQLRNQLSIVVKAVHVDHGLQPESAHWTEHCRQFAEELGVNFISRRLSLDTSGPESVEALARKHRYAVFGELVGKGEYVFLGHHQHDQAETLMLQMLRGAGVAGLAGMPVIGITYSVPIVRPMLDIKQQDIYHYAEENRLSWVEDASNENPDFDRNYLRHHVMPQLARWPAFTDTFSRTAANCAESDQLLRELAEIDVKKTVSEKPFVLSIERLSELSLIRQKNLLRYWIKQHAAEVIDSKKLSILQSGVISADAQAVPVLRLTKIQLRRYRDQLWLLPVQMPDSMNEITLFWEGEICELPHGLGCLKRLRGKNGIHPELWQSRVEVRWRQPNAKCQPVGRKGSRSIKKLAQDRGIPPWVRELMPLIYINGELAAVADYCIADAVSSSEADSWVIEWHPSLEIR